MSQDDKEEILSGTGKEPTERGKERWDSLNSIEKEEFLACLGNDSFAQESIEFPTSESEDEVNDDTQLVDNDDPLLTALSAELCESEPNLENVIGLCKRIGEVHPAVRGIVWESLLCVQTDEQESWKSSLCDEQEEENTELLLALSDTALLRASHWERNPSAIASLRTSRKVVVELAQAWARQKAISASATDPGLADVIVALNSPTLKIETKDVLRYIDALQQKYILLLTPQGDESAQTNQKKQVICQRALLLEKLIKTHDPDFYGTIISSGEMSLQTSLPFRWWRCAFAGETGFVTLLELWDVLIFDSCPEACGDSGPKHVLKRYGLIEGCDPRGPICVYIMLAIILRTKTKIPSESISPSKLTQTACSIMSALSPSEARTLCKEAQILRRSTQIDIIQDAEKNPQSIHLENTPKKLVKFDGKEKQKKSSSSWWFQKSLVDKKASKEQYNKRLLSLKLTFGIGEQSAAHLKAIQAWSNKNLQEEEIFQVDESVYSGIPIQVNAADTLNGLTGSTLEKARKDIAKSRHVFMGLRKGSELKIRDWETCLALGNPYFIFKAYCAFSSSCLSKKVLIAHGRFLLLSEELDDPDVDIVLRNSHVSQICKVKYPDDAPNTVSVTYRESPLVNGGEITSLDKLAFENKQDISKFISALKYSIKQMAI